LAYHFYLQRHESDQESGAVPAVGVDMKVEDTLQDATENGGQHRTLGQDKQQQQKKTSFGF
jgi:hypothetical protein